MRAACVLVLALAACAPTGQPAPINSPVFATRGPLPGQPGYLETIKFIDDGLRYVDPWSQFFVSPAGEMCFHKGPSAPRVNDTFYQDWCIPPQFVDRVSVIENFGGGPHGVELWCMRAYPQCAHSPETGYIANRIYATTLDYRQERAALQNLVYMMGGSVKFSPPRSGE
jgi:hypothetical protein